MFSTKKFNTFRLCTWRTRYERLGNVTKCAGFGYERLAVDGLPGTAYLLGSGATNAIWTAIGLALGTYFNWLIVAKPLRKYTQIAGNSITIPDFLQNRFHSKSNVLRIFSALFILIFFTVYTSSMFAAGANLFDYVFGIGYIPALILSVVVVTAYTFLWRI